MSFHYPVSVIPSIYFIDCCRSIESKGFKFLVNSFILLFYNRGHPNIKERLKYFCNPTQFKNSITVQLSEHKSSVQFIQCSPRINISVSESAHFDLFYANLVNTCE